MVCEEYMDLPSTGKVVVEGSELMTAGYQLALKHVSRRLDNLLESAVETPDWVMGVEAAQYEVQELKRGYVSGRRQKD